MIFQDKIKLALENCNLDEFNFKEITIAGDSCVLVTPKNLSVAWNQYNKYLRSVIYRKSDYYPVSLSFPKFPNWLEKPDIFPVPESLNGTRAICKEDGSTLILSRYKNVNIIRSRGSDSIEHFENKQELEIFKQKYPLLFTFGGDIRETIDYSILCEWASPTNKIILDYKTPELFLIGGTGHEKYELITQDYLDFLGKRYNIPRPASYKFNSILDMLNMVKEWKDREGIVLYSDSDTVLHKIKADDYLKRHYFKSTCNLNSLMDLFFEYGCPELPDFLNKLESVFDHECMVMATNLCLKICQTYYTVLVRIKQLNKIVENNKNLDQKQYANLVLTNHKEYSNILFLLRKFNKLDNKDIRKMMERELGNI